MAEEPRSAWQVGALKSVRLVADNMKSFVFELEKEMDREAGMHCDIRLTASDGYQAERSYSVVSAPEEARVVEFGISLAPNGEVSTYMWGLSVGSQVEILGPIGKHFIWNREMPGPIYLVSGGAGITPLLSILRHYLKSPDDREVIVFFSARNLGRVAYRDELKKAERENKNVRLAITLTEQAPPGWRGYKRRIDEEMLREVFPFRSDANIYICGPTAFVETAANLFVRRGFPAAMVKTERFG